MGAVAMHDEKLSAEQQCAIEEQIVEQSKRIEFFITEYSVELLASKMEKKQFVIPDYQREDNWESERKSRFIESVIIGLPIPFLFFWEMPESGQLEIVDGSQRLRTISQFLNNELQLTQLERLDLLSGLRFRDLKVSRQLKIMNRSIRGIVLNEHADEQSRFDAFERINTGSLIARKAEVRRGALVGPFLDLVIELAVDKSFDKIAPVPPKKVKLREREELVTRFFAYTDAFCSDNGFAEYRDRPSQFLFNYMKRANAECSSSPDLISEYRSRFVRTMDFIQRTFPYGFRRTKKGKASPLSRFEAISVGAYLALKDDPELGTKEVDVSSWVFENEFMGITRADGANAIAKLRGRVEFVRDKLAGKS